MRNKWVLTERNHHSKEIDILIDMIDRTDTVVIMVDTTTHTEEAMVDQNTMTDMDIKETKRVVGTNKDTEETIIAAIIMVEEMILDTSHINKVVITTINNQVTIISRIHTIIDRTRENSMLNKASLITMAIMVQHRHNNSKISIIINHIMEPVQIMQDHNNIWG